MEQVFLVKNGNLAEVNNWLQKGGRVKSIHPVSEIVSAYGYAGGRDEYTNGQGSYVGNIYAYVVIEFN